MTISTIISIISFALLIIVIIVGMCYIASLLDQRRNAYAYVEKHTGLSMDTIIRASRGEIV